MAMHTRRDLLRHSLLLGGTLCTPRWAACQRSYTAARYLLLVAGDAAFVGSVQTQSAPPPAAPRTAAPATALPSTMAPAQTTSSLINPVMKAPTITGANQLQVANQITFTLELGASQPIDTWVAGAVDHTPVLQDGSICALDFNYQLIQRTDWTGGAIAQVIWPACDVTSTAAVFPAIFINAATLHYTTAGAGSSPINPTQIASKSNIKNYWRACDFLVSSNANINPAQIAGVSALTLVPAVYGGTVSFGYYFGFNAAAAAAALAPFQAATQTGGMLLAGQSTDIAIQYGLRPLPRITLRGCRVASVSNVLPTSVVTMNYADALLSV